MSDMRPHRRTWSLSMQTDPIRISERDSDTVLRAKNTSRFHLSHGKEFQLTKHTLLDPSLAASLVHAERAE